MASIHIKGSNDPRTTSSSGKCHHGILVFIIDPLLQDSFLQKKQATKDYKRYHSRCCCLAGLEEVKGVLLNKEYQVGAGLVWPPVG
ncbi:3'-phosphoadenosine 5'-phosphosulfate sulfotransferase (PAPS reductase)/FAD synthetase and related enzymes [Moorella thermoacetica Y72]|uniref:3'-phosphoadenosine 5'-phosphosulfate sulfotransferase (PAPS reductase)/FAD synthetase and related enzymes n=1 Tax=Moorella thermoacetica Y72 TaxID=1325331 RepID=A0A0S6UII8_NEOTH|nr:3'-phosphoadenosine 5'-phosphosulfate sulfotransferase (PAPS reductase)/FAD synthetase and related enzymes [Moorella thermoacetica Y72]